MSWYEGLGLKRLDGSAVGDELAGKALLVVNVASACGYTPQYKGLVTLHGELGGDGFAVVGVPCNQFGAQEPGTPEEIATFCETRYAVDFPLLEKQEVNGAGRSALYRHLIGGGADIKWNFEKFVVDKDGKVTARFGSKVRPEDAELRTAVAAAIG
ncbi:MAG: glutathione peroxidase [Myxococcota bacterium]